MAVPTHQANNRHTDNWWLEDIAASLAAGGSGSSGGVYNATPPTLADGASTAVATDNNGNSRVVGNVASGATDVGAPVKVGGRYNTTKPTLTNGQRGDLQVDANGNLFVNIATLIAGEDLIKNWQRVNNNNVARLTLQASAAQTASNNSALSSVGDYREAIVTLNVTAASGTTPTLNVKLQTSDDGGTTWYDLPNATFTQATAATTQAIQITNFGDTIRAVSTIAGTTPSFTYAIKAVGK